MFSHHDMHFLSTSKENEAAPILPRSRSWCDTLSAHNVKVLRRIDDLPWCHVHYI